MDFGVNIFSFKKDLAKDEEPTYKRISELGVKIIEPWINIGKEFDNPVHIKNQVWKLKDVDKKLAMLKKYGLSVHTAFMIFCEYDGKVLAKDIQLLHDKFGIEGFVFMDTHLKDRAKADLLCDTLNVIAENISDDVVLLYHNHDNEYQYSTEDGQPLMEYIMNRSPRLCFEADLAWFTYVGKNPSEYLEQYKDRVKVFHMQDLSSDYASRNREELTCAVGSGVVDLKTTLKELDKYPLIESCKFIVDQDYSPNQDGMYEDIASGMKFLSENL